MIAYATWSEKSDVQSNRICRCHGNQWKLRIWVPRGGTNISILRTHFSFSSHINVCKCMFCDPEYAFWNILYSLFFAIFSLCNSLFYWILALFATLAYCNGQNINVSSKRILRITDITFSIIHTNFCGNPAILPPDICAPVEPLQQNQKVEKNGF